MFPLLGDELRTPEELLASGLAVIDRARNWGAGPILPLFSGGHDSTCACHVAQHHPKFSGVVHHIDTGIGSKATRQHVENTCRELGWMLRVWKSPDTYERFVAKYGFPGPAMHRQVYALIKERCVRQMVREHTARRNLFSRVALISGARIAESERRMGHATAVQVGEKDGKTGKREETRRVWASPCFDWSIEEQQTYMDEFDLPRNPVKIALGMSGECFCGAFGAPGEIDRIRQHCPDVAVEIDRLAAIARENGKHAVWGTRPDRGKGIVAAESGPLCSSCDVRAKLAGVAFRNVV